MNNILKTFLNKLDGETQIKSKLVNDSILDSRIICNDILKSDIPHTTITNNNIYRDLEVFTTFNENSGDGDNSNAPLFNIIDKTSTMMGKTYLKNTLENPLSDIQLLYNRQNILKLLLSSEKTKNIHDELNRLSSNEDGLLWFWKEMDKDSKNIFNSVYFNDFFTKIFNKSEYALSLMHYLKTIINPGFGVLSPIVFLILPYFIISKVTKYSIDFNDFFKIMKLTFNMDSVLGFNNNSYYYKLFNYGSKLVWLILYVQGIISNFYYAYMLNNITTIIFEKIRKVSNYILGSKNIINTINEITKDNRDQYSDIQCPDNVYKILNSNICERLYDSIYRKEHVFYSYKGKFLKIFLECREHYETLFKPILLYIGKIDNYMSIIRLYKELKSEKKYVCFPEFKLSPVPIITTKKNWFIKLKENSTIVTNSYKIGDPIRNCVITGPNAGGKSTHIKTVIFSVLLSQTFGIVPSKKFTITPFHKINTYLNIPDNTGKESLFQAEMCRCRDYIDNLEILKENEFSIIVMDEIFSSTNPEDGIAAGFSILEYLANKTNNMCLITTHYKYLTDLRGFKNYKFPVKMQKNGGFKYMYKLKKGINDQYIAIELLKEYMNNDIYKSAIHIRKKLLI
jgi:DNA mismatch repair protein MutS